MPVVSLLPPDADAPTDDAQADAIETAAAMLDDDVQARLWLRAIVPLLQLRSHDADPINRVQYAFDSMTIAACERAARILQSDLAR